MNFKPLFLAIRAACPVESISIGKRDDKSTWRIDFKPEATPQQRAAGQAVIDAFDLSAPLPPKRNLQKEIDDAMAVIAALIKKGTITRQDIDAEKGKPPAS